MRLFHILFTLGSLAGSNLTEAGIRGIPDYGQVISQDFVEGDDYNLGEICVIFTTHYKPVYVLDGTKPVAPIEFAIKSAPIVTPGTQVQPSVSYNAVNKSFSTANILWLESRKRYFNDDRTKSIESSITSTPFLRGSPPYIANNYYCEKIPYATAYSKEFIESAGKHPFLMGFAKGKAEFQSKTENIQDPFAIPIVFKKFGEFEYTVPIFGKGKLTSFDFAVIRDFYDQNLLAAIEAYKGMGRYRVKEVKNKVAVRRKEFVGLIQESCGITTSIPSNQQLATCYDEKPEVYSSFE